MKMRLKDVTRHYTGLASLGDLTLPSKVSFTVAKNMESLLAESERMEKERKRLCERYAEKDDDGKPVMADSIVDGRKTREYKMSPEGMKTFDEEYRGLLETETELPIAMIKRDDLIPCEENERYSIPAARHIAALMFMVE